MKNEEKKSIDKREIGLYLNFLERKKKQSSVGLQDFA